MKKIERAYGSIYEIFYYVDLDNINPELIEFEKKLDILIKRIQEEQKEKIRLYL